MGFLNDRRILITGVLSNRSIAYGVARACQREGATLAFTYVNDDLKDRVVKLASDFGTVPVLRCDVSRDEDIDALFATLGTEWGGLDGLLHSIAFAPREALAGDFLNSKRAGDGLILTKIKAHASSSLRAAVHSSENSARALLKKGSPSATVRESIHAHILPMLTLEKFSLGVGDRFAHQAAALSALTIARSTALRRNGRPRRAVAQAICR